MAVATAGSVPPMHGGEAGKNACDNAGGRRALNSTEPVPPDAGQGGLRGRETALPPAGGGVPPTWPQHHPRGTRSCDKRRPEHSVGWRWWWAGEQGTHPDSQSRSLAGSRRRAGRGGVRRCPGGAERRQAGRRHSARGPVSLVGRQAAPLRRRGQLACPTSRCCCSNLRAGWAAGTLHVPQRPAATGISASRPHCCATGARRLPRYPALEPRGWLLHCGSIAEDAIAIHTPGRRAQS